MAKGNQIKKLVNGEIADADDVNQIAEDVGSEGGTIPYDPTSHERSTDGTQSLGSTAYPWGSLKINQDAELVEVDTASHTAASSVAIKNLRKFITLKDVPASFSGQSGKFAAVKSSEDGLVFVNPPTKSTTIFSFASQSTSFCHSTSTSYQTVLFTKWKKTAGISTVTFYASINALPTGQPDGYVNINIGGHAGSAGPANQGATWLTGTVDVSALTNETVYDVVIQIKSATAWVNLQSVIAFGD